MPCNPAIGGTAKGHLVREIDALGGLMGRAIDATGIQFKLLNRSRGPAVWSPRAQADKRRYSAWVAAALEREPNIEWIFGEGRTHSSLDARPRRRAGARGRRRHRCRALVVTTGTFLNGLVHIGPEQRPAGRAGEPPSHGLAESLKSLGFRWGRLKTGTPPRLDRRSLDFSRVRAAGAGDDPPVPFSFATDRIDRAADRLLPAPHQRRGCTIWCGRTSASRRCTTGRFRASARAIARRSKTRSCASRTGSGTSSFSSPKASTSTRST